MPLLFRLFYCMYEHFYVLSCPDGYRDYYYASVVACGALSAITHCPDSYRDSVTLVSIM
ncbi:MAG: hypothetical protein J7502_06525 [Flavisolibacter sp.]|nr:hypothetical protein [Flavisolibacter sp.]